MNTSRICALRLAALIGFVVVFLIAGSGAALAASKQATFESPEAAADALVDALKTNDERRLIALFGPDSGKLIGSGDATADQAERAKFKVER